MSADDWVERAAALPIAFAQVREDPRHDAAIVEALGRDAEILMVASGGCTAAVLATMPSVARLHLVDPNPAQISLARLKLRMLERSTPRERRELLGHSPLPAIERWRRVGSEMAAIGLSAGCFGSAEVIGALGPDHAGRYERLFAAMRHRLADERSSILELLCCSDPADQLRRGGADTSLGRRISAAIHEVMTLDTLVRLFGEGATRRPAEAFPDHFVRRLQFALGSLPAVSNPFLWQFLAGEEGASAPIEWLDRPAPTRMPTIDWTIGTMTEVLASVRAAFDFIHLSNILDWLAPEEARGTLDLAFAALRPGGRVLIRQLNSTIDVPRLGSSFEWDPRGAAALLAGDRSFFYREMHLGVRR